MVLTQSISTIYYGPRHAIIGIASGRLVGEHNKSLMIPRLELTPFCTYLHCAFHDVFASSAGVEGITFPNDRDFDIIDRLDWAIPWFREEHVARKV